ncbi:MAG: DUF1844 domain-containing protein [Acidobacteria bacterium]|nr:DUF1844 domain-containing protein [Acidobacteriota bacterium]MCZ6728004.1 DUF1844 domain-containing protein [Acidobacteriota bacterium]
MTDSEFKVNDKRMFTADGRLREEFKHLEDTPAPDAEAPAPDAEAPAPAPAPSEPARESGPRPESPAAASAAERPPPGSPGGAGFLDLVGLLAQHTAVYLGDAALPDGRPMLDLGAAQMHIDLLDALRDKTAGNLTAEEGAFLEDVLYRLRLAYVEKCRSEA